MCKNKTNRHYMYILARSFSRRNFKSSEDREKALESLLERNVKIDPQKFAAVLKRILQENKRKELETICDEY